MTQRAENDPACARERWPKMERPGQDWGRLMPPEPPAVLWRWPCREMEIGDRFHVAAGDLSIEQVRARAHRVGGEFKFSVSTAPNGDIVVQRVLQGRVGHDAVNYRVTHGKVAECYRTDDPEKMYDPLGTPGAPDLAMIGDWQWVEMGTSSFEPLERIAELPARRSYVTKVDAQQAGGWLAVELEPTGVRITVVPRSMTQRQWDDQRLQEALG